MSPRMSPALTFPNEVCLLLVATLFLSTEKRPSIRRAVLTLLPGSGWNSPPPPATMGSNQAAITVHPELKAWGFCCSLWHRQVHFAWEHFRGESQPGAAAGHPASRGEAPCNGTEGEGRCVPSQPRTASFALE